MKRNIIIHAMLLLFSVYCLAGGQKRLMQNRNFQSKATMDTTTKFNVNNISMTMRNNGQLIDAVSGAGFEWPRNFSTSVIYTGGLWIGSKVNNNLRIAAAQYDTSCFLPGTMKARVSANQTNPAFRFYKIGRTDTTGVPDYNSWINQGAPGVFGKPLKKGDQNIWCVYNDGRITGREFYTKPLYIEAQQFVYGDSSTDDLNNTVFAEFKIINRDTLAIDSAYISLWLDIDIGGMSGSVDDVAGVDTSLGLAYCYNGRATDPQFGPTPPAVGILVLRGPGGISANRPHSFVAYDPFTNYPGDSLQGFNLLTGLTNEGNVIVNPVTHLPTRFMYSGDAYADTGWVDTTAGDKAMLFSYGPFSLAKGDSTYFHAAIIVARGTDRLNSVAMLKQAVPVVQAHYVSKLVGVTEERSVPVNYSLGQNYPNPFNPTTHFEFRISDFRFVSLKVYDVLGREVVTLVNEAKQPGSYDVTWDASNMPSGVYFYRMQSGTFISTKKLVLIK